MEPYSRIELVLLKKEEEYLKLGKQRMSKAGEKRNGIKWHQHHHYDTPSTIAAEQEEGQGNKNIGFIEIDKPDNDDNDHKDLKKFTTMFDEEACLPTQAIYITTRTTDMQK